jgi:hypothetical protein
MFADARRNGNVENSTIGTTHHESFATPGARSGKTREPPAAMMAP